MFTPDIKIDGLDKLQEKIDFIEKIVNLQNDKKFNEFIQDKVIDVLMKVMNDRFDDRTTNPECIDLYKSNNKIENTEDGFILYNDTTIEANVKDPSTYPEGKFSIALAFEYGVGIIGQNTVNPNAWEYNVNGYNFGWYYTNQDGESVQTAGYMGYEIYRYTAEEVNKNISNWYIEYLEQEV